jgi:D-aminopeptidase
MDGVPVGRELGRHAFAPRGASASPADARDSALGSCLIVVATDAPLAARDLERLAARAVFGLARTGSSFSNGSGDYAIAFSTEPSLRVRHGERDARERRTLPTDALDPLFQATLEATEEAVLNALLRATTLSGSGRTAEAIPLAAVTAALAKYGRAVSQRSAAER